MNTVQEFGPSIALALVGPAIVLARLYGHLALRPQFIGTIVMLAGTAWGFDNQDVILWNLSRLF